MNYDIRSSFVYNQSLSIKIPNVINTLYKPVPIFLVLKCEKKISETESRKISRDAEVKSQKLKLTKDPELRLSIIILFILIILVAGLL